ncbi:MAG: hypothetical protein A2017_00550 [Lentisphaerae bacterium GWF2_44_16]|nr:MAG: hypothetical protein A2017_00550 [Lentisphaerae bacterium GWF2_44_16]
MKRNKISIVAVGINGYGHGYLANVLDASPDKDVELAGVVDPAWEKSVRIEDIKQRKIPAYSDLESFYKEHKADLAVISSPIHLHVPQSLTALANGSHVLCEKPLCATIQEAATLAEAARKSAKLVSIGYQWSFSEPVQALKNDIINGLFGAPISLKTLVLWPRREIYYKRNNWAGAMKNSSGKWILDSPINNATAHYLHNMLYILGPETDSAATLADVQAELYRANKIQNFDTAALRCHTDKGVEILFYSAHAIPVSIGPVLNYRFEKGTVYGCGDFTARFTDGTIKKYGVPHGYCDGKLWQTVESIRSGTLKNFCSPETASAQTLCINGAQDSMPDIVSFPENLITVDTNENNDHLTWVKGLDAFFIQCFDLGILPSEHGNIPWAKAGKKISLADYKSYPGGCSQ